MGFENTEHVPYDEETYGPPSDALKKVWEEQGWNGEKPYPGVQHMKVSDAALAKYGPKEAERNLPEGYPKTEEEAAAKIEAHQAEKMGEKAAKEAALAASEAAKRLAAKHRAEYARSFHGSAGRLQNAMVKRADM
jgi:hypothetical protein